MQKPQFYIINGITLYRLAIAPVLIILVLYNRPDIYKWLLPLSFFTDAIDGYFARKFNVTSIMGAKLDSIADDFTIVAAMTGIIVFKQEFLKQELLLILSLLGLFIFQIILALFRYKKISSFHTYGAKLAFIFQGCFIILLFFLPDPLYPLFYATVIITALELIEEIIITLLLPDWESNVKGLYWVIKKR